MPLKIPQFSTSAQYLLKKKKHKHKKKEKPFLKPKKTINAKNIFSKTR